MKLFGKFKNFTRITTIEDCLKIKSEMEDSIRKYLEKTKHWETIDDVIIDIKCYLGSPLYYLYLVHEENQLIGFFILKLQVTLKGSILILEHINLPKPGYIDDLNELVNAICEDMKVKNIYFATLRNQKAMEVIVKKLGYEFVGSFFKKEINHG